MAGSGLVYAIVSDNQDPEKRGRVKVSFTSLGEGIESGWMDVAGLYSGAFFVPELGDQVVVAFIGSGYSSGVVLGSVWSSSNPPPETGENSASDLNKDGENNLRFIKSRSGQMIILDDKAGEEKIQIISPQKKSRIEFLCKEKEINIETEETIVLQSGKGINLTAEHGHFHFTKQLKLEAEEISVESKSKNINFKAGKNMEMKGKFIKLN